MAEVPMGELQVSAAEMETFEGPEEMDQNETGGLNACLLHEPFTWSQDIANPMLVGNLLGWQTDWIRFSERGTYIPTGGRFNYSRRGCQPKVWSNFEWKKKVGTREETGRLSSGERQKGNGEQSPRIDRTE
jgi:hypothetical protein